MCLSLLLPRDVPWLRVTAAAQQDGAGTALRTLCFGIPALCIPEPCLRAAPHWGMSLLRPTRSLHPKWRTLRKAPFGRSVWVPSIKPSQVLPLGQGCSRSGELFLL